MSVLSGRRSSYPGPRPPLPSIRSVSRGKRLKKAALSSPGRVRGNPVNDPLAVPDVLDQPGVPEDPELMGNARLGHPEDKHKLADAEVALEQEPDDPEACPVG
ncbi:MAG: hypothetical protein MZV63_26075 [Marinilabiliales bacterium]|nr:hypothetical protein [Marinilabiliales bacterium]